ncbi:hypothetical protein HF086_009796 [Spodoptera exigua]|uniref:CUB domain-containing protein n=1 Tax=Spodoptera exigua TaxID=7107 RepID=A0A922S7H5_SPOEX|nr:hypothetical protein HF086_009796 [Spodoptera exigua]
MLRCLQTLILITIVAEYVHAYEIDKEHQGPQPCGGRLKGPVGTITTPNFPNPFPVPIKCKWIIEHDTVNGTISIYFTQQYTTSGLTFTEYMYYDESYKLGERRALTLTDENITRIKWLQVNELKSVPERDKRFTLYICFSILLMMDITQQEPDVIHLDGDVLKILGEDPSASVKFGPEIHKELASRLTRVATEGLGKGTRRELISKYLTPANCSQFDAPNLNLEIKAALLEPAVKRDKGIEAKQKQMASAISGLSVIINTLITSNTKDTETLQKLVDICRILCDIQHGDSITRRNFILFSLKNYIKNHLKSTRIDTFLFGENLSDILKTAKAVNKTGTELKVSSSSKSVPKKQKPAPAKAGNYRAPPQAYREPSRALPYTAGPASAAPTPRAPPPPPRPAHSSRMSSQPSQRFQRRR